MKMYVFIYVNINFTTYYNYNKMLAHVSSLAKHIQIV